MSTHAKAPIMSGLFVPIVLTIVLFVAKWIQHKNDELAYKMMEMGFIITISLRLMIAVELRVASKIGKLANFCLKHFILPAQYFIYPCLCAWICSSICWWSDACEKDKLPQGGLKWCFIIFVAICMGDVYGFVDSCVDKHMAERQARMPHAELHIPISDKAVVTPNTHAVISLGTTATETTQVR